MRILFVVAVTVLLGLAVLVTLHSLDNHISVKHMPDRERHIDCYITSKGAISCVPEQGART